MAEYSTETQILVRLLSLESSFTVRVVNNLPTEVLDSDILVLKIHLLHFQSIKSIKHTDTHFQQNHTVNFACFSHLCFTFTSTKFVLEKIEDCKFLSVDI